MSSLQETKHILDRALEMERQAEDNCAEILRGLAINGFHDDVAKIQNDEKRHQELARELLNLLR